MTESSKPPSRIADQFVVRLPVGMRGRIAEEAKKNNRSMNAEIVARLESSFYSEEGTSALVKSIGSLIETVEIYRQAVDAQKEELAGMRETLRRIEGSASSGEDSPRKPRRKLNL